MGLPAPLTSPIEGLGCHVSGVGLGLGSFLGQHPLEDTESHGQVNKILAFV